MRKVIMHVIDLSPKKIGAFEEHMIALSRELSRQGHEVIIFFAAEVPEKFKNNYGNVKLCVLNPYQGRVRFYYLLSTYIAKYRPDILHFSFYPCYSLIRNVLAKISGAKHIIYSDRVSGNYERHVGLKKYIVWIRNYLSNIFIDKVICVSNYIKQRNSMMAGVNSSKLCSIHNGINIHRFNEKINKYAVAQELGIIPDSLVVTTVATMADHKGIPELIEAASFVLKENKNIMFVLVGEGAKRKDYQNQVKQQGIESNFIFTGLRSDVERILSISDVFVYPSIWAEAFGFAIAEAMAMGLPVISTNVGGIPELITNGVEGLIVPPGDSLKLSVAINTLLDDQTLRVAMGDKAKQTAENAFSLERMVNDYLEVYREFGVKR